jgi:hypothetical protein
LGLESRHLETRAKAAARLGLEVAVGRASPSSRGLLGWRRYAALHRKALLEAETPGVRRRYGIGYKVSPRPRQAVCKMLRVAHRWRS